MNHMSDPRSVQAPDNAGVIAPPPLIALATLGIGLAIDWLFPVFVLSVVFTWPTRVAIGGVLFAAGAVLAVVAERTFRRIGTNVPPWQPTLQLATAGIYEWVRNPMYVGTGLMVAGAGIAFASNWTLILLIPAALVLHYGVVKREERYLEAKFGDDYRRYKERVPRYGWPV